jgi:ABC-type multidrug transport system permease subunit
MIRRMLAVLNARNLEFVRDRSSLGWNIALPVLLVFGLSWVFAGPERPLFEVGVLTGSAEIDPGSHPFLDTRYVHFFKVADESTAVWKIARHKFDMLLDLRAATRYWVNSDSPKGYMLEKLLLAAGGPAPQRQTVEGVRIRYIDWLLPGILGMNIMFSCLFGVGYVVVRYRKNGFLKRLQATPLRPIEFIGAQVASRLMLIMVITVLVYVGTRYLIGFRMQGSHLALFIVATLGAVSMISLGLLVAARVSSEELAGGVLNLLSWPMMLLSGVWFSMEGAHPFMQQVSRVLPLTHVLDAARAIMLDGAGIWEVRAHLAVLAGMSAAFLLLGAWIFRWRAA